MRVEKLKVSIPFKENFIFFIFVAVFLLQAYMHNNNIVYIFVFFILGIITNNYFLLKKNLKNLEFFYISSDNRYAKESANIHIRVQNRENFDKYDIKINNEIVISLPANSSKEIILKKIYNKRGKAKIPILHITSAFPLYIFDQYYCDLDLDKEIIIFPEKRGIGLESFFDSSMGIFGEREDFKGVRTYSQNDSFSRIHWKSLAKGSLMSKEYYRSHKKKSYIFDYNAINGDMEKRLSQLTLWAVEAKKKGYDFEIKLPGGLVFDSKKYSLNQILTALALYG